MNFLFALFLSANAECGESGGYYHWHSNAPTRAHPLHNGIVIALISFRCISLSFFPSFLASPCEISACKWSMQICGGRRGEMLGAGDSTASRFNVTATICIGANPKLVWSDDTKIDLWLVHCTLAISEASSIGVTRPRSSDVTTPYDRRTPGVDTSCLMKRGQSTVTYPISLLWGFISSPSARFR